MHETTIYHILSRCMPYHGHHGSYNIDKGFRRSSSATFSVYLAIRYRLGIRVLPICFTQQNKRNAAAQQMVEVWAHPAFCSHLCGTQVRDKNLAQL